MCTLANGIVASFSAGAFYLDYTALEFPMTDLIKAHASYQEDSLHLSDFGDKTNLTIQIDLFR